MRGESWAHGEWLLHVDSLHCAGDSTFAGQTRGDGTSWGAGVPRESGSKGGDTAQKECCGRMGRARRVNSQGTGLGVAGWTQLYHPQEG